MSALLPPPVDPRDAEAFAAQAEALVERYTGWRPPAGDPAHALAQVFARMASLAADRLNRVPDRAFLAFLDLLRIEPRPPQPARVPLTFRLAAGSAADAVVPARTPVAALALPGDAGPVGFETERELAVTRSTLQAVIVHEPARDRWADRSGDARAGTAFPVFSGAELATHRLWISHRDALGGAAAKEDVVLHLFTRPTGFLWPEWLDWAWHDAAGEHPLAAESRFSFTGWTVTFRDVPPVPVTEAGGEAGAWLSARLRVPLVLRDALPDAVHAGGAAVEPGRPFHPFGRATASAEWFVAARDLFTLRRAPLELRVELDPASPAPAPEAGLRLAWEYTVTTNAPGVPSALGWEPLGVSSPDSGNVDGAPDFDDGTRALTRGGTVSFRVPFAWKESEVGGKAGVWLRVRVAEGGYGTGEGFQPPAVRLLTLGYTLPITEVTRVTGQQRQEGAERVPAAAFAGTAPVDPSRDFHPFGEAPRRGDVFHLAVPELLGLPGGEARLLVALHPPARAVTPPLLRWEYWDGAAERWELLGESGTGAADFPRVTDPTMALTQPGSGGPAVIRFDIPPTLGKVEVNGRLDAWIRVRIAGGGYGEGARYEEVEVDGRTVWQLVPATYAPPAVRSIRLAWSFMPDASPADVVASENDWRRERMEVGAGLVPFTLPASLRPTLYLGFDRPGDVAGFANRPTPLYFGVAAASVDEPAALPVDEPARVAWQYWNGVKWTPLGVVDETAVFTRRGMVTFVGPADLRATRAFGREAFWLRARLERGGWRRPPRLERVLLNTVWAEHATRLPGEVLGSGTGKPGQAFRTTRAPVLPGERIEVREPEPPAGAELDALRREAGDDAVQVVTDAAGGPGEAWVRWTCVPDFHASGSRSRHYTLDRATGEIRFGDGVRGMAPPAGRGNVRAAEYRTGGGPAGNRPAGNVAQLKATVPYVDRVDNPEPAAGGAPAESLDSVRLRGPRTLRHRGRAVTVADLEDLAMEASPGVAVARAIAPEAEGEAGHVRVIVVPRGAGPRPAPTLELLDRVEAYLAERVPATVSLEVLPPAWLGIDVEAEVVPASLAAAGEVRLAVETRLAAFLHPLTGGPQGTGWPFGRRPYRSDLFALIEGTPGVDHVRRLSVREAAPASSPWFLVTPGTHAITVAGSTDGA